MQIAQTIGSETIAKLAYRQCRISTMNRVYSAMCRTLQEQDKFSYHTIAHFAKVDRTTAIRLINILIAAGLVRRVAQGWHYSGVLGKSIQNINKWIVTIARDVKKKTHKAVIYYRQFEIMLNQWGVTSKEDTNKNNWGKKCKRKRLKRSYCCPSCNSLSLTVGTGGQSGIGYCHGCNTGWTTATYAKAIKQLYV